MAQELATLASEVGMAEFRRRYDAMKSLRDTWIKGKEAIVCVMDEDTSGTFVYKAKEGTCTVYILFVAR